MARRKKPELVATACASGDYRRSLVAVRDRVSALLDAEFDPKVAAVLSAELRKCLSDIAAVDAIDAASATEKVNTIDELAGKRVRRRAASIAGGSSGSII